MTEKKYETIKVNESESKEIETDSHTAQSEHDHVHGDLGRDHGHSHPAGFSKNTANRLARAIGHLEKTKRMVENEADCIEVMMQLLAVRAAIDSASRYILKEHINHCVVDAAQNGDQKVIEDLKKFIDSYLK